MNNFPEYRYKGASALVKLHEIHLQSFYETWKQVKRLNVKLPDSDDPYYKSLDTLLYHLLRSARGYMIWMCEKLNLDDPLINETPIAEIIEEKAVEQLAHLFVDLLTLTFRTSKSYILLLNAEDDTTMYLMIYNMDHLNQEV